MIQVHVPEEKSNWEPSLRHDIDLVRELLVELEKIDAHDVRRDDFYEELREELRDDEDRVWGHLRLMEDDGLVEITWGRIRNRVVYPTTVRVTSKGHVFLRGTRSPANWRQAKKWIAKAGRELTTWWVLYYLERQIGE